MKKYIILFLMLLITFSDGFSHIGSPDILYEGMAGPYQIEVMIEPPDVVPGIAKIMVNIREGKVKKVVLQPIYFDYGSEGAPEGDIAIRSSKDEGSFSGQLWLMAFGSASVKISVEGLKGLGSTVIPVPAIATATRQMETSTEIVLIILGMLLFAGLITIIGVSNTQATLERGKILSLAKKRKAMTTMAIGTVFLASGIYFAKNWWDHVEGQYKKYMYKPLQMNTSIEGNENSYLKIDLSNRAWFERKLSDIVPDHGKLMHLFIIGDSGNTFVHLHPQIKDSSTYISSLPSISHGSYSVFADVVHEDGLGETITDTLNISNIVVESDKFDPDDSWLISDKVYEKKDRDFNLSFINIDTLYKKKYTKLEFIFKDHKDSIITTEPYMGMAAHAVIMKTDGSVFVHLHPMGTVSMAAQSSMATKISGDVTLCNPLPDKFLNSDTISGLVDIDRLSLISSTDNSNKNKSVSQKLIQFPYSFPEQGDYFIWVQAKKNGRIYTNRYTITVI